MKKLFFTALFALLVVGAHAQKKILRGAQRALKKKEYAKAIDLATQASQNEQTAENPQVYVIMGKAELYRFNEDKTDFAKAQSSYDYFQKAIELGDSKLEKELMEDAFMNEKGERFAGGEGLKFLQALVNIEGNVHLEAQDFKKMHDYFRLSSDITPDNIVMAFYTGYSAYMGELDSDIALKYYIKVLELNAVAAADAKFENADYAYNGIIDIYLSQKEDYENALKYVRAAKEAYPENKQYSNYEIDILIKAEKMDEAITGLKAVVEAGDAADFTYYRLAYLLWNNGEEEEALAAVEEALKLNASYYDALYVGGSIHFNQAVELLKTANNTDDNDEYAKLLEQAKEKFRLALPYVERAVAEKPEDLYMLNPLSTIYDQLGMDDKRDEVLEKIKAIEGEEE